MSNGFYRFCCAVMRPVYAVLYPAAVEGLENIPEQGSFILCCNHCSARDPFYLAVRCRDRKFHFMAKSQLFKSRLNVTPKVAVIALNTLPRSEKKTRRVFDHREE